MATIKAIKVGEITYDIKATYDASGNIIDLTYAQSSEIPTNISLLTNDSNYLTEHLDISYLATKQELSDGLSTKLDSGDYALKDDLTNLATKEEVNAKAAISDLDSKLDILVSGTSIKTIYELSILGEGNIELPIASNTVLGGVKVGAGLSINSETGTLSTTGGGTADSVEWDNILNKPDDIVNITDNLAGKVDSDTYNSDKVTFATKEELSNTLDSISDMATLTWVLELGYLTEHLDISQLATKDSLNTKVDKVENKSLVDDTLITKLTNLSTLEEISGSITDVLTTIESHINNSSNPHLITKELIGLGNVDNTADIDKPVSTAMLSILDTKVDKVTGKDLSTNDFTETLKTKLESIEEQALKNSITGVKGNAEEIYRTGEINITPENIGLGNVNNTSDIDKPVSSAVLEVLDTKVDKILNYNLVPDSKVSEYDNHLISTSNPHLVTKAQLGLENVDNTSDVDKPISIATLSALDVKVDKESGKSLVSDIEIEKLTGLSSLTTIDLSILDAKLVGLDALFSITSHVESTNNPHSVTKSLVGLDNVDNTSDLDKPISTATQTALDTKVDKNDGFNLVEDSKVSSYDSHLLNTSNPHSVTKALVGLENVDNTSDSDKPISKLTQEALDNKVDKELGKLLSTENYSTAEKEKLAGIEENANNYSHPETHEASIITLDSTHRFVSDAEKTTWNNKAETTTATTSSNGLMSSSDKSKLDGIAENANNYSHPTTSGNKHIPTGGSDGLLLSYLEDGTAQWSDSTSKLDSRFTELNTLWEELDAKLLKLNLQIAENDIDLYSYGVEWDITVSSPVLTRIGNPLLHKSLPIQSAYRGCVSNGTTINYYLYSEDWNYKEDGVTPSVLDGTDGVVRVHTPKFYGKSGSNGNKRWVRISLVQIDDSWVEIPEMLIDAYRCTVNLSTNKAVSVVNTSANYRGGDNNSGRDTYLAEVPCRSDLGKPRTNVSRATMRTYANNAGSLLLCYEYYKWIFYWNYVIEYANFNCLAAYNAELTSDGYRLGGLGLGVTTIDFVSWVYYNDCCPLTPCGYCNEIGNNTGVKSMTVITPTTSGGDPTQTYTFSVPRWRGFDNPFGDIWTNLDGVVIHRTAAKEPSNVYTSTTEFTDEIGTKTVAGIEIASDGYTTAYDLGETGEIIPSKVGGSESTYMCDYHYCHASYTSPCTLQVGGRANLGGRVGVGCFCSSGAVSYVAAEVGFRTLNVI